jgi:mercuric ion binding protein
MKTLKILIVGIAAFIIMNDAKAQSDKAQRTIGIKTQTVSVQGVCGMCKKLIETAALKVDGVKSAIWNENTKKLSVAYSVFKPNAVDEVQKQVSAAGHDAGIRQATAAAYKALPDCC